MNLPDYNFLSAPLWLITTLHIVTLTLHLIAMNFLLGSMAVLLVAKIKDKWNDPTVLKLIKLFPNIMAATVSLGVAPLLFVQLVYAKQIYSASIVSAWFWLMIFMAAMISYYLLYGAAFSKREGKGNRFIYLTLAIIGLLYISFIYSSVFSMAENPNLYKTLYAANQSGLVINPDFGSYIFRWLHMLLGAVTVGAFFVGWIGRDNEPLFAVVKKFFIYSMILGMIIGTIYMMTLGNYLGMFMRSSAIWLVTFGFLMSLASIHFFFKKKFIPAAVILFLSMLSMIMTRHILRLIYLNGKFDPAAIPVTPQWSVFIIFLICFVIAIGLVWYMLKLFFEKEPTV